MLDVLNEFGPWCADRAALNLIAQIEKSKIKTPYERHYLLLCLVSTALIQIRAYCEQIFSQFTNERECVEKYSSPKALRLLEILRQFKPDKSPEQQQQSQPKNTIEQSASAIKLKCESNEKTENEKQSIPVTKAKTNHTFSGGGGKKPKNPFPRLPRQFANNYQNDPNALCGLIFCNSIFTAKILFSLIYEMTKHDPDLDYLSVQFTGDRIADPITETKQFENEHRKQEEVLKRFRMHSCNLLIGTSVLEEGIELPKCNLVVRWNLPTTYRSYVQCKGRARAQKAYHIIMVSAKRNPDAILNHQEFLCDENHKRICASTDEIHQCYDRMKILEFLEKDICDDDVDDVKSTFESDVRRMEQETERIVDQLAEYMEIERILLNKCSNREPTLQELIEADSYTNFLKPYKPIQSNELNTPFVSLATAVVLVNKYCAKLPSDTFTKLTPLWRCIKTIRGNKAYYQYTVRLPINSPVKQDIYVSDG